MSATLALSHHRYVHMSEQRFGIMVLEVHKMFPNPNQLKKAAAFKYIKIVVFRNNCEALRKFLLA